MPEGKPSLRRTVAGLSLVLGLWCAAGFAAPAKPAPARPPAKKKAPAGKAAAPACTAGQRPFTVTNSTGQSIWLGVTSGTISCLADSNCPTGAPGSCVGANPAAGQAGTCGCTGGCGSISQCGTDSFCHWNLPPLSTLELANKTSTTICFPAAQAGMNIQWSGNIFARTGCNATGQSCQTADCGNQANQPCAVGKGGNPPASLAEFTLSNQAVANAGPDFYDVSIINGVNVGVSMAPVAGTFKANAADPYSCGTPGSAQPYGKLQGCPWKINPTVSSANQATVLRDVAPQSFAGATCPNGSQPNSLGNCACTADTDCGSKYLCGLAMNAGPDKFNQVCGQQVGWWTPDQICSASIATPTPYGAPLNCATTLTNSDGSTSTYTNLYNCSQPASAKNPEQAQSCYNNQAIVDCCGCATSASSPLHTSWPNVLSPSFGGPDGGCYSNNPNWVKISQPWLVFLKQACPTAYTYPFDDATSTFTCSGTSATSPPAYAITFLATQ